MLRLPDSWVWDHWIADDGSRFHVFFLFASRALHEEHRRHRRAAIGHAVSTDLVHWERVADALVHGDPGTPDELATWTGSVVRGPTGTWFMYYTGVQAEGPAGRQRVCLATSDDLMVWSKQGVVVEADPRWYEQVTSGIWADLAFRDPWVYPDPDGDGWHMLITARANEGPVDDRGVVGRAHSHDLLSWQCLPPATEPGVGFGHIEVPQVATIDGRSVILFSCLGAELSDARRAARQVGGTWYAPAQWPAGPFELAGARLLHDEGHYAGRLVRDRNGRWQYLAFRYNDADGTFLGELADPTAVSWRDDRLVLEP